MAFVIIVKNCRLGQLGRAHPGALKPSLRDREGLSAPFLLGKWT
jgi:hypothetical protein